MKTNSFWIKIFAFLLCIFAGMALILPFFRGEGTIACIKQDGKIIQTIDLKAVTSPYRLVIQAEGSGSNTVSVDHGSIAVTDADCPDHICVDHGAITQSGDPIVCLPHKLVVEIVSKDGSVDSVSQ